MDGERRRFSAFADVEERYRQRYADLAVNPEVRQVFRKRAQIVSSLRTFLDGHDFLEQARVGGQGFHKQDPGPVEVFH